MIDFGTVGLGLAYGTVRLVPADKRWSTIAETLSDDIAQAVPSLVRSVEHIGSTAIPGLLSKPIVDLAIGMPPGAEVGHLVERLARIGWIYRGDAGEDGGLVFVMEDAARHRVAHAHGVVFGGPQWIRYIALRELLRHCPSARQKYEETKTKLVARFPNDPASYTAGKTPTVHTLLAHSHTSPNKATSECIEPGEIGLVDYDQVAVTYEQGRAPLARSSNWEALVAPYLPAARPLRILDLGAGTGIFSRVWPQWGASLVVGVDPSAAMLTQAKAEGLGPGVHLVVGLGERVPLSEDAVDVAWMSAVIHHIADRRACARELRRVVVPGGRLFLRGFFADLSQVEWLGFFPGAERAAARFPTIEDIEGLFATAGFSLVVVEEAPEPDTPIPVVREWLIKMRYADSLLNALTDDEFGAGLAALDQTDRQSLSGALHLAVFT